MPSRFMISAIAVPSFIRFLPCLRPVGPTDLATFVAKYFVLSSQHLTITLADPGLIWQHIWQHLTDLAPSRSTEAHTRAPVAAPAHRALAATPPLPTSRRAFRRASGRIAGTDEPRAFL